MARVLVTGADGFIGRHLVPALRASSHDVRAVGRTAGDITLEPTWASFADAQVVVHLAGTSYVPASWADPRAFLHTNVRGTIEALEFARARGARVIFLSSYLYGHPMALPIPESAPLSATNPYALSKLLADETCRFYAKAYGIDVVVLRPFNVYGPGQPNYFLIARIVDQALAGSVVRVKDLAPRRDFVYVADLVKAILAAVETQGCGGVYNVGSGMSHSVSEVIRTVESVLGLSLSIESSEERRPDELMDTVADITRARASLGWVPRIDFESGIRATIAAVQSAGPHVDRRMHAH